MAGIPLQRRTSRLVGSAERMSGDREAATAARAELAGGRLPALLPFTEANEREREAALGFVLPVLPLRSSGADYTCDSNSGRLFMMQIKGRSTVIL